ncbi:MAG: hypothetical protein LCH37_12070 [Bacteroidetes bacterium]|nr:hypothetical protein [Bacteroidota bacterium]
MRIIRLRWLLLVFILVIQGACRHPLFSVNFRDKKDRKQGLWKVYYDSDNKKLYYKIRYKNNKPTGKVSYYYPDGKLQQQEIYKRNKTILTTYYWPNGKPELKGTAQLIITPDTTIYQWIGPWEKFDSTGKLTEVRTYRNGQRIWTRFIR